MLPVLGKLGVWVHYQANLRYYAEVLCENQDKPDLNCDGHCVLAQRIAATTPQPPTAPSAQLFQFELSVFLAMETMEGWGIEPFLTATTVWSATNGRRPLSVYLGVEAPPPDDFV